MKLLAIVAIGVIACLGTPDVGFAKSRFGKECSKIHEDAHSAYTRVGLFDTLHLDLFKKNLAYYEANKMNSPDLQNKMKAANETLREVLANAAHYAQIYSAFCK